MIRRSSTLPFPAISFLATGLLAWTPLCPNLNGAINNVRQESPGQNSTEELVIDIGFLRNQLGKPVSTKPMFFYNGTITPLSDFASKIHQVRRSLESKGQRPSELTAVIRAAREVSSSDVQDVIRLCQEVGFERFSLKQSRHEAVGDSGAENQTTLPDIKIRLRSNQDGSLAALILGRRNLGNDKTVYETLNAELLKTFEYLDLTAKDNIEVQLDIDHKLDLQYVTRAVGACTRFPAKPDGQRYVKRVKFTPATARQ